MAKQRVVNEFEDCNSCIRSMYAFDANATTRDDDRSTHQSIMSSVYIMSIYKRSIASLYCPSQNGKETVAK